MRAPLEVRYLMVSTEARIRVSSVMVLPSRGTLRSQRMRTFLPLSSASMVETDFLAIMVIAGAAFTRARRAAEEVVARATCVLPRRGMAAGAKAAAPATQARPRTT